MAVGLAFTVLQVTTVEALPSTGVAEGEIVDFNSELPCTDADKDREACRGDMAQETLQSQAGKDINAGRVDSALVKMEEKGSGKKCAAGEDCQVVDFNAELACTEEDTRAACTSALGGMGGASTGGMGSSPERP
jgi:hypothetical protein